MIIILMGVSGCGKTTVGRLLAEELGWPFYDGDDFHPPANVEKMRAGIPLDDNDRDGWLTSLQHLIRQKIDAGQDAILACSALKQKYRDRLQQNRPDAVRFVYLKGDFVFIQRRLQNRRHFMNPNLLQSQFDTLEEPAEGLVADITQGSRAIVKTILHEFNLRGKRLLHKKSRLQKQNDC